MANIALKPLADIMQGSFHATGQRLGRFETVFLAAVNGVIAKINRQAISSLKAGGLDVSEISQVTSIEGEVGLDSNYQDIFADLVSLRITRLGQRPSRGSETDYKIDRQREDDLVDDIRQGMVNELMADDDDDEQSFAALGPLGSL